MSKSYRPANGATGESFMCRFCLHCEFYNDDVGCPILNATFAWPEGHPEYPNQWVCDDDMKNERCLAFCKRGTITKPSDIPPPAPVGELREWAIKHGAEIR